MGVLDPTRGKKRGRSIMPEMGRLIGEQGRLKKQRERIAAQKIRGLHGRAALTGEKLTSGELARHIAEDKRLLAQEERILKQYEAERKRAIGARSRGEAGTGIDRLEKAKIGRETRWSGKWARRKAKLDTAERKYMIKEEE